MFQIEEFIMYDAKGACRVKEIKKAKNAAGVLKDFYVLQMVYDETSIIMTPTDNERVNMRPILSEEDAQNEIRKMPELESTWNANDKIRIMEFKNALKSNDCREWIKLSKTLYRMRKEKSDSGKKLSQTDEDIFRKANKMVNEEMSLALGIPIGQVEEYIQLKLT